MSLFMPFPFLTALGWALLNTVWQFAIVAFLYRLITLSLKNITAAARHAIALGHLFSGALFFLISLSWRFYSYPSDTEALLNNGFVINNDTWYNAWQSLQKLMNTIMPYGSLLYLISVALLFIRFCLFVQNASRLRTLGTQKMDVAWRTYTKTLAEQLGISKPVNAFLSMRIDTPQVIGVLKPVILVPFTCLTNLSTEQLETVLLHELAHIKRNDYLVNLFVSGIEILFFFNPFVKQLVSIVHKEREYSCDDMVIQFKYQPHHYAAALLALEKNRTMPVNFGIAAGGKDKKQLLARVKRIVGIKNKEQPIRQMSAYLAIGLILCFIALVNPAKLVVDKPGPAGNGYTTKVVRPQNVSESTSNFTNDKTGKPAIGNTRLKKNTAASFLLVNSDNKEAVDMTADEDIASAADIHAQYNSEDNVQTAAAREARDFSLPENEAVAAPAPELATATPYVPANSFYYQYIQDSTRPKIKGETYAERAARETLVKARKAIESLNWQKIEKTLKYNKHDLAKLKLEVANQLSKLNWQQINKDAQRELNLEQAEKLKAVIDQDQAIKNYARNQAYFEAVQKQMLEQEQLIKANDLQWQKTRQAIEQEQKKIKLEMKKRRIIYI